MERRNSNILLAFLITVSCFCAVVYTSCSKSDNNAATCENINCKNGGQCVNGACVCPYGYEGANCEKNYHDKFLGGWGVHEKLFNSSEDTTGMNHDSLYTVILASSTTSTGGNTSPTSFFIQKMMGNPNYVNVVCVVDTLNTSAFYLSPMQSIGHGEMLIYSGWGSIDNPHNTITGMYVRNRFGSPVTIFDTISYTMSRQ